MRVLLDTQAWLWMLMAPERFSRQSLRIVEKTAERTGPVRCQRLGDRNQA